MPEKKPQLPNNYDHLKTEAQWNEHWQNNDIYRWNPDVPRNQTFVVDTPPPTVSGSLHIGHVYSYAQTDFQVRFQRMQGKNIYYPMGWDDNGLPTERRVQNVFHIRCDANIPYNPDWKPEKAEGKQAKKQEVEKVSRQNFIEACHLVTAEDEKAFERLWRKLGLSVDWHETYATIDDHCRKISQLSFLDLVEKGKVIHSEAITMWDIDLQTAVAQAEVEDREVNGAFYDLRFGVQEGGEFIISTTRPELLAACIAVAAHPEDKRYQPYFGKTAITPLFFAPVPIVASEHADPEKGSGILMICTFGDIADVEWWRASNLPLKQILGLDGRLLNIHFGSEPFSSIHPEKADSFFQQLVGLRSKQAKKVIAELLTQPGSAPDGSGIALAGEPKPIQHTVRFYEKGDNPLEFIPTRQWFIQIMDDKKELLAQGEKIHWHPGHMHKRYESWVEGLNQNWCISRQRYFGVPFPVWYPLTDSGEINYEKPIFAAKNTLPIDPQIDTPPGYTPGQRNQPGGFLGEPDVMDTWATSSMTPQISSSWGIDNERHPRLFPADLRPQAHDIIRTWAFYTIVKAWLHNNDIPWKHAAISGFILDPDRKKMSKSKGNVVTPEAILDEHSADVVRYWASKGRLGVDVAFDQTQFKIGRRLMIKIFNASKFVLNQLLQGEDNPCQFDHSLITEELDRAWVQIMRQTLRQAASYFENFDYTGALQTTEDQFWYFCDNYIELSKIIGYRGDNSPRRYSALATLSWTLKSLLRLFAPFFPFITEEVWSWYFADEQTGSIHLQPWPTENEVAEVPPPADENSFKLAAELFSRINLSCYRV